MDIICIDLLVYASGYVNQLAKVDVQLHLDFVLCLHLGECANVWDRMDMYNDVHAPEHSCM